jgi:general stress protein YciG
MPEQKGTSNRGFASMDRAKQRAIASKGGQSVPPEKRSFSQDPELAAKAGRKGGESVPPEGRSFSQNRELAAQAGRKGGMARGAASRRAAQQAAQQHQTGQQSREMANEGASRTGHEFPQMDEMEDRHDLSAANREIQQDEYSGSPEQPQLPERNKEHPNR